MCLSAISVSFLLRCLFRFRPIFFFFKTRFCMVLLELGSVSCKHIKHQAVVGGVARLQAWPHRVADDCE